jgi:hypothetical protein
VRLEFAGMLAGLVVHFGLAYPLDVGGLLLAEEHVGFVHAHIRQHLPASLPVGFPEMYLL